MSISRPWLWLLLVIGPFGCRADGLTSSQTGPRPRCSLDGPVVDHPRLRPAMPRWLDARQTTAVGHILPAAGTRVTIRYRVDESGRVTSGCPVGEVNPDLGRALIAHARGGRPRPFEVVRHDKDPPFRPAWLDGREVASAVDFTFCWYTPDIKGLPGFDSAGGREANDVTALERMASRTRFDHPGDAFSRGVAYARLGELGTPEALAALARIEAFRSPGRAQSPAGAGPEDPNAGGGVIAYTKNPAGVEYGLVWRGPGWPDHRLTWRSGTAGRWRRPVLISPRFADWTTQLGEPHLTWAAPGRLDLTWDEFSGPRHGPGASSPVRYPGVFGRRTLVVADIERDADGDGWTDIEERWLGLDPEEADTDRDGTPDFLDSCPDLAASDQDLSQDEVRIHEKALFVVSLLWGERVRPMFLAPAAPRVVVFPWSGLLVFGCDPRRVQLGPSRAEGALLWRVTRRTTREAAVMVENAPNAIPPGHGLEIYLRKRGGIWLVVAIDTGASGFKE